METKLTNSAVRDDYLDSFSMPVPHSLWMNHKVCGSIGDLLDGPRVLPRMVKTAGVATIPELRIRSLHQDSGCVIEQTGIPQCLWRVRDLNECTGEVSGGDDLGSGDEDNTWRDDATGFY